MFGRNKDSAAIRRDALAMAQRKADAGCASCAEQFVELARQHGATEEEIARHAFGRRKLLGGLVAGVALTGLSLVDASQLGATPASAAPASGVKPLAPSTPARADQLAKSFAGLAEVKTLRAWLAGHARGGVSRSAWESAAGGVLVEQAAASDAMLVVVFAGADHFEMGTLGDVAYAVHGGTVAPDSSLTNHLAQARQSVKLQHPMGQTPLTMLGPQSASAACPSCGALIAACGAATAACGACVALGFRDCNPVCGVAAGTCLAAINCCNS